MIGHSCNLLESTGLPKIVPYNFKPLNISKDVQVFYLSPCDGMSDWRWLQLTSQPQSGREVSLALIIAPQVGVLKVLFPDGRIQYQIRRNKNNITII